MELMGTNVTFSRLQLFQVKLTQYMELVGIKGFAHFYKRAFERDRHCAKLKVVQFDRRRWPSSGTQY